MTVQFELVNIYIYIYHNRPNLDTNVPIVLHTRLIKLMKPNICYEYINDLIKSHEGRDVEIRACNETKDFTGPCRMATFRIFSHGL